MRVLYYTRPCFLDCALHSMQALSRSCDLHACVELDPQGWTSSVFDLRSKSLPAGIRPAASLLNDNFPQPTRQYWDQLASFNLVVHNQKRNLHPATWWRSWTVARFVNELRPDVVHLDDVSLRLAPLLWAFRNCSIVASIHDPLPHSGRGDWKWNLTYGLSLRQVDRIVVHSEFCRELALRHLGVTPEQVSVVPLGVYDVYRDWIVGSGVQEEALVLFVGRIAPYKGVDLFLEGARLASDRLKGHRFVVAGKSVPGYQLPPSPPLRNGNTITILDRYLGNAELAELMQRAAVVVCPYMSSTQSGVVLTAYAFDKPVIATRVGGLPEYVRDGETGMIVPPGDPNALADAIVRFLNDAALRNRMRSAVRSLRSGRLSWNNSAGRMMAIYRELQKSRAFEPAVSCR